MIRITLFVVFCCCWISCKKDIPVPNNTSKQIFNMWRWVKSDSGQITVKTPKTEEYELEMKYYKNGKFKRFKNGRKINSWTFSFSEKESIFIDVQESVIDYSEHRQSKKLIIPQSYKFIGSDTLILRDECYNCYTHYYVKSI